MQKNSRQILEHFYSLLMEMNFHRPDEDVFDESGYKDNPFIQKHLRQIKLKIAKYKARHNKGSFKLFLAELRRLKSLGKEELDKLFNREQQLQLQPLFRKFEELSKKDEESIENDAELLQLMAALRDQMSKSSLKSDDE